jgi:protein tyrosine phosphatase
LVIFFQEEVDYINASLLRVTGREFILTMAPLDALGSVSSR